LAAADPVRRQNGNGHEKGIGRVNVYLWMAIGMLIGLAIGFGFGTEGRIAGIAIGAAIGLAAHTQFGKPDKK
jgi:hypothetical protein